MTKDILKIFVLILIFFAFFYLAANPHKFLAFLLGPKSCYQTNQRLLEENISLKNEMAAKSDLEVELENLKEFCGVSERNQRKYFLADVIGLSPFNFQPYFIIDAGSNSGLKEGMPVVLPSLKDNGSGERGIVLLGIISKVEKKRAKVLSLYDKDFSASVYVLGNGGKRNYSLVKGESDRIVLSLISQKESIALGESVLTSGFDQKFPAGLYVGEIESIGKSHGIFKEVEISPLFNWQEISKVLVITEY